MITEKYIDFFLIIFDIDRPINGNKASVNRRNLHQLKMSFKGELFKLHQGKKKILLDFTAFYDLSRRYLLGLFCHGIVYNTNILFHKFLASMHSY